MLHIGNLRFATPLPFAAAALASAICIILYVQKELPIPRLASSLLLLGMVLLTVAAGTPMWQHRRTGGVTVMVDLSSSTRGATFRRRPALDARIQQLLGQTPYQVLAFSADVQPLPQQPVLPDLPAEKTVFIPPPADAVLLFSDGQFSIPPTGAPTYPVIDPALDNPPDAAVQQLEWRQEQAVAMLHNSGNARKLTWTGATPDDDSPVDASMVRTAKPTGGEISATLSPDDRWPENDRLTLMPPVPSVAERWWVGERNPGESWRHLSPGDLPTDAARYLSPAVIVLDNLPAEALSSLQQDRLTQYVRDLGGSLFILGGDHAFAAGGYDGSALDALSPLASSPPKPQRRWLLLTDASGSMAADTGNGVTAWQRETAAILRLLPRLPPDDSVSIGGFSDGLSWWLNDVPARQAASISLPPPGAQPHGPTNLEPVLRQLAASTNANLGTQLLVMTDGEADLPNAGSLAQAMLQNQIHLSVLAIGNGKAIPALTEIARATGGVFLQQSDARLWEQSAGELLKSIRSQELQRSSVTVQFDPSLNLSARQANPWNRTWVKPLATELARAPDGVSMAARWSLGTGQVAAVAYAADVNDVKQIAGQIANQPRDPRLSVAWTTTSPPRVRIDAIDAGKFMNNLDAKLSLHDSGGTVSTLAIPQTAPGRYELEFPPAREPRLATVIINGAIADRTALAGRYPPEFDHIGNNPATLDELARRTGGRMIEATESGPVDFRWPIREFPLLPACVAAGAMLIAGGLVLWRRG